MSQTTITLLFLAYAVISFILEKIPLGLTASILSNTGMAAALGGNLSIIGAPGKLMGVNALQEMVFSKSGISKIPATVVSCHVAATNQLSPYTDAQIRGT